MRRALFMFFIFVSGLLVQIDACAEEITAKGAGLSREQAVQAAMRDAVEQGLGAYVKSQALSDRGLLVEDKILSHVKGYVTKFSVLAEDFKSEKYIITIRATVDGKLLKDDIDALSILRKSAGNPRLLVVYKTDGRTSNLEGSDCISEIYGGIVEALADRQFRVVDRPAAESFSRQIADTHSIDTYLNKAAAFGLSYDAEYTLFYDISADIREGEVYSKARLRVKTRLVDNTRSQVISSKITEVEKNGRNLAVVLEKAGRECGQKAAGPLIEALQQAWMEMQQNGSLYTIVIDGLDDTEHVAGFNGKLEKFPAVSASREVESGGGKAVFEADYRGKRDQLDRDVLRAAKELGWQLQKIRAEGARSTWKKI